VPGYEAGTLIGVQRSVRSQAEGDWNCRGFNELTQLVN
jgi:hypothetical protein